MAASRLTGVLRYAEGYLTARGHEVQRIDVVMLPAEDLIRARRDAPEIAEANRMVEISDVVMIGSPVYQASYTGLLKTFLDTLPQKILAGKIILPLLIGGSLAHLLAMDYALKPVLSALGARHILGGVYAVNSQVTKLPSGDMRLEPELAERLDNALEELAVELGRRSGMRGTAGQGADSPEICSAVIGSLGVQIQ